jgi:hypothetical protein
LSATSLMPSWPSWRRTPRCGEGRGSRRRLSRELRSRLAVRGGHRLLGLLADRELRLGQLVLVLLDRLGVLVLLAVLGLLGFLGVPSGLGAQSCECRPILGFLAVHCLLAVLGLRPVRVVLGVRRVLVQIPVLVLLAGHRLRGFRLVLVGRVVLAVLLGTSDKRPIPVGMDFPGFLAVQNLLAVLGLLAVRAGLKVLGVLECLVGSWALVVGRTGSGREGRLDASDGRCC